MEENAKQLEKNCPQCSKIQLYSHRSNFLRAIKANSPCHSCVISSDEYREKKSLESTGRTHSEETKKKLSDINKGKIIPPETRQKISINTKLAMQNPEIRAKMVANSTGKVHSEESKKKMSDNANPWHRGKTGVYSEERLQRMSDSKKGNQNMLGKKHSDESKQKMSNSACGKKYGPMPEDHKVKHRIAALKKIEELGIPLSIDAGSKEWFDNYNKETNSNFRNTTFQEIGYIADGYDSTKHIWIEYDTIYHKGFSQSKKDIERQNNIIKYFEDIGNPLTAFLRYITWDNELKTVYAKN